MPLKVSDLVRFVAIPGEWEHRTPFSAERSSRAFLKEMIRRTWPSRITKIDKSGFPWIEARIKKRGKWEYHYWMLVESTGWRLVNRRSQKIREITGN